MNPDAIIAISQLAVTTLVGIVGAVLSWAVYRLSTQQRDDSWLQLFGSIHDEFWNDEDLKEVRAWLACDAAYGDVGHVLHKRRDPERASSLTSDEYAKIEKLDKFLNLMTRIVSLDPQIEQQRELLRVLFFTYWLRLAIGMTPDDANVREDLHWYVRKFYPTISDYHAKLA